MGEPISARVLECLGVDDESDAIAAVEAMLQDSAATKAEFERLRAELAGARVDLGLAQADLERVHRPHLWLVH